MVVPVGAMQSRGQAKRRVGRMSHDRDEAMAHSEGKTYALHRLRGQNL